jgi:flagellin-specific chaperone FliS
MATDVTGILLAGVMAALGLFIIPTRRRNAKKEMRQKVRAMREQLSHSLEEHFGEEIDRGLQGILDTINPYTRFVRAEKEKNNQALETLQGYLTEIIQLEDRIGNLKKNG